MKEKQIQRTVTVECDELKSSDLEQLPHFDVSQEKKLVHKFDCIIMPLFCSAYFFSALDRSNIGNAKVAGMSEDLSLSAKQFSNAVSIVYATYITVMLPGVWVMRLFKRPRFFMGGMIICWSLVSIFTLFVRSYGSLLAVRLLLGLFEGSFFSCMTLIATDYYLPVELGRRTAYYFVASALSSSFGGLIATGITNITSGALKPWHYLYLIEGILSLICGVCVFLLLPDGPELLVHTEAEKAVYESRVLRRKAYQGSTKFDKNELRSAFGVKLFCSVIMQFCQDICLYGFSTFLPSILKTGLGYSSLKAQYMTVPVYLFAGAIYLVFGELSDRKRMRGPIIVFTNIVAIIGYVVLLSVKPAGLKYFACYLICFALYIGVGLNESWLASNTAPSFKRGTSIAINQTLGNIAGAVSPQVYVNPPDYKLGNFFTLGCLCVSTVTAVCCTFYLRRRNRIHQQILESGVDERKQSRKIGDDSPEFQFLI
ncbi:CIC11C00000001567 [Sungouiella intermedia]|uniref:CIC11C00000001567 n=1 Tax=Sungouiella intermedia TaxID=45354 RepID=A0A1L0DB34_9ASCO|nr:CIC11C00000001567 [[Candida] intermedia]